MITHLQINKTNMSFKYVMKTMPPPPRQPLVRGGDIGRFDLGGNKRNKKKGEISKDLGEN
jgi:hypothetical protein